MKLDYEEYEHVIDEENAEYAYYERVAQDKTVHRLVELRDEFGTVDAVTAEWTSPHLDEAQKFQSLVRVF
jgi:hypothetical protein